MWYNNISSKFKNFVFGGATEMAHVVASVVLLIGIYVFFRVAVLLAGDLAKNEKESGRQIQWAYWKLVQCAMVFIPLNVFWNVRELITSSEFLSICLNLFCFGVLSSVALALTKNKK